jgi:hypothetical protein
MLGAVQRAYRVGPSGLFVLLIASVAAVAQVQDGPQAMRPEGANPEDAFAEVTLGFDEVPALEVQRLVAQLGDASYARREEAVRQLEALGPGTFRTMAEAFRTLDNYEIRLRIEDIVRTQYLWYTLLRKHGFLGVGYQVTTLTPRFQSPRVMQLTMVQPGSAADDAGLEPADKILSVDGESFENDEAGQRFRNLIQSRGAGGVIHLSVSRGGQLFEIDVTLKARPLDQYANADTALVDELNARLQDREAWWRTHFAIPPKRHGRTPSSQVLELPE